MLIGPFFENFQDLFGAIRVQRQVLWNPADVIIFIFLKIIWKPYKYISQVKRLK